MRVPHVDGELAYRGRLMMAAKSDHVVYNGETQRVQCNVCGESYPLVLPMSITMFCRMGDAFVKEHRTCALKRKAADRRMG